MTRSISKPALVTATLAGSIALAGSAFAATPLTQGYMLGASGQADVAAQAKVEADAKADTQAKASHEGKCGEGTCGGASKDKAKSEHEGKCGEGRCGMDKMDTDADGRISSAEFAAAHDGDTSKFAEHDPNGDGFIDAAEIEAHHADKKASHDDKAVMEGKCGEGKCGAQ